ncbi:MAG TPA: DUF4136 domain-containing protein [Anaeromyxobacteraceae bacterium]|nr:DUF4136 domain-containing protein [Anaeromyxobacteraceae bacterium]
MPTLRLPAVALLATLAGCSTMKVATEYEASAPFEAYKTWAWLAVEPGQDQAAAIRNPLVRKMVVEAVEREMAKKGLQKISPDANPDFYVTVIGAANRRIEVTSYGYAYAGPYAYAPYGMYPVVAAPAATEIREVADGTLVLDFVDAKAKQLVWRGTASDSVTTVEAVRSTVDEAVRKMLENYPPPKKK